MAVTLHAHTMSAVLSGNRGAVGVGIANITFNVDYTMTITLTDGSTYTSGNLRGAQGIPGIDADFDGEELVITEGNDTISDGGEVSTIRVKGEARTIRDRVTEEMACSAYPTETVTGDIVHFTDGADGIPVKSLSITLTPTQSGTGDPSPTNIRPISGWDAVSVVRCGKNLYPVKIGEDGFTNNGGGTHSNDSGVLVVTGTASSTSSGVYSASNSECSKMVTAWAGKTITYSFEAKADTTLVALIGYARNGRLSASLTTSWHRFTSTVVFGAEADAFTVYTNGTAATVQVRNLQIEFNSTATDYEPYAGQTYPIPLPSTVYGGTLDVSTGVMTVDRAMVTFDGTASITTVATYNGSSVQHMIFGFAIADILKGVASDLADLVCNLAVPAFYADGVVDERMAIRRRNQQAQVLLETPTSWGAYSLESLKQMLTNTPLQVVYALATPTTITLDPVTISTLLGNNTIYADAGQVTVCYRADVGLYIDKRIAEVQALVLES